MTLLVSNMNQLPEDGPLSQKKIHKLQKIKNLQNLSKLQAGHARQKVGKIKKIKKPIKHQPTTVCLCFQQMGRKHHTNIFSLPPIFTIIPIFSSLKALFFYLSLILRANVSLISLSLFFAHVSKMSDFCINRSNLSGPIFATYAWKLTHFLKYQENFFNFLRNFKKMDGQIVDKIFTWCYIYIYNGDCSLLKT